ncbi:MULTISPECIES: toxin-activating lysine-acyltransferase [unclassified Photobacterium]|uniref:toxin-activating lysine-acyltransferase n=1 Tax=unclassified Photobacterium TaxID=2628852 RepID=UPI000D15E2B5
MNISSFLNWVKPAILHDQFFLIREKGKLEYSGYVIWAWVDDNTYSDFMIENRYVLQPMSWNEGENLFIDI